jgi:hypothetical protein
MIKCVFVNGIVAVHRVLTSISVSKRDEVTGGWRKLHKKELRDV